MRVLCIGDSLALPREECSYESTWFYKLQHAFPQHEFIDFFKRGLLIPDALHKFDTYYQFYGPDVVIIQTGICDCSPRYINDKNMIIRIVRKICKVIHLEPLFWKTVKLRKRRQNCVYTRYDEFKTMYAQLVQKLFSSGSKHIILIKIGHAAPSVLTRNPYMNLNVDKYNYIMDHILKNNKGRVTVLDPLKDAEDGFFIDGYHCNPIGMVAVYEQIKKVISEIDARTE